MFYAVSGHSEDIDTASALDEILEKCEKKLSGQTPKAGLLFAGIDAEHQALLDGINEAWPGIQLIGCTTDGELSSDIGFQEDSVTLFLIGSDSIDITAGIGRQVSQDITGACRQAVEEARSKTQLKPSLCIANPESLTTSGQQIVMSLNKELEDDVPILGATAGDQWRFEGTYQFYCNEVLSDTVPILLFSGPLVYAFGVASGWKPLGEPGQVTRSQLSTVHEIDGAPAIEFYRKFLGSDAKPSGECPLAILNSNQEIEYLRATPGTFDEETGAITYVADVQEGARVQITVADRDAILTGCRESLEMAMQHYPEGKTPEAAVFFSCAARKLLLGTRTSEEYQIIREKFDLSMPMCGFYGYGEIGPIQSSGANAKFHNETFISLLLGT